MQENLPCAEIFPSAGKLENEPTDDGSGPRSGSIWLDRLLIAWVEDPDGHPVRIVQNLETLGAD
jgi:hypothetical protein